MGSDYEVVDNPSQDIWKDLLKQVVEGEGWLNSVHDYSSWLKGFRDGQFHLLAAIHKETGRLMGAVSVGTYDAASAKDEPLSVYGMFVVLPEFRGQGIGLKLFDEAMKLGVENKFLFAAQAMSEKYASRYGFDKITPWRFQRLHANCSNVRTHRLAFDTSLEVKDLQDVEWSKVHDYDRKFVSTTDRRRYLEAFLTQEESYSKVVLNSANQVIGICHIRSCHGNQLGIGPLYANDQTVASTALRATLEAVYGLAERTKIHMNIPSNNEDALELFRHLTDCEFNGETLLTPQFTKKIIEVPTSQVHDFDEYKPGLAYYANLNNYPKHEACNDVFAGTQQRRSYDNDSAKLDPCRSYTDKQ
ncbi:Protein T24A6.20 [Aphelenchoides avenae]|nr:Protein T24A6.20 [Aphelenchus avenae]